MPDLRRSLFPFEAVAVGADLEPGSGSVEWVEDRRADKEREEGIMEERELEDLLEVMLGNMTFGVLSVSVRPGSSPGRRAAAVQCSDGAVQRRRE